jgi:lipoprotein-anchoring transpeptidase ErfK/SrfK
MRTKAVAVLITGCLSATCAQGAGRNDNLFEPWRSAPSRTANTKDVRPPGQPSRTRVKTPPINELAHTQSDTSSLAPDLRRQVVTYSGSETAGTIIIDTANTHLYLVLTGGKALRYGIGVGREGFTWAGREKISRMAEWPDWRPPAEMVERSPELPDFMPGGLDNPLGARALYLGKTLYRIHGTNEPDTIGRSVSSGCIRMRNQDVIDLYQRVSVGAMVVVLGSSSNRN